MLLVLLAAAVLVRLPVTRSEQLTVLNSPVWRIPLSSCEIRGILHENDPIVVTVMDEKGHVMERFDVARLAWVEEGRSIAVLVRREDRDRVPALLGPSGLRVVVEPRRGNAN
ncbi:hypothetical protein [Desulfovirgula thermocuniculi]|uniref:hypothetical protein n=1 Tax=Desulfovirgula thermocuniculi TaxID=348842 RepID=UPI0012EB9B16|nr:hypothetical protein [Desulfovirgula thermocuniculi]